jgi:hypothetical protein
MQMTNMVKQKANQFYHKTGGYAVAVKGGVCIAEVLDKAERAEGEQEWARPRDMDMDRFRTWSGSTEPVPYQHHIKTQF